MCSFANRKKLPTNIIKERIQKEKDALKKEEEDELENKKEADIVFQGKRMIIDKDRKMNINYSPLQANYIMINKITVALLILLAS